MEMDPWVTLVIAGAAIAGYGWLKPEPKAQAASIVNEEAYDRLLEDLETENRELVDAVAAFKREQDDTVSRLGRRIRELERQMEDAAAFRRADTFGREELAAAKEIVGPEPTARPASSALRQDAPDNGTKTETDSPDGGYADKANPSARAESALPAHAGRALAAGSAGDGSLRGNVVEADIEASSDNGDGTAGRPAAIRDRYAQLLELHERGHSVEQVAKAMNMNKGEVQLILQLAKREANRP